MTVKQLHRAYSKTIRKAAGVSGTNYPITLADGAEGPKVVGRSYYWTTPSGKTEVRHPNAYGWKTWYHHSERRIIVGRDWLLTHGLPGIA